VRSSAKFEQEEKALDASRLEGMIGAMASEQTVLAVPKFRVQSSFVLRSALESLGIKAAFHSGADFSRISSEPGFALDEILHKTYVE
jgi:serpin B